MKSAKNRYIHLEKDHNLNEPQQLVPVFLQFFDPVTVCDIGCGVGNFLSVFKSLGKDVMGFDGPWANREIVSKYLSDSEFQIVDFELGFPPVSKRFDLALCLEVAEHIRESKADDLIAFLTKLSDNIIFSAAIPFQGGDNHINERWESYWEEKFNNFGFFKYDLIRHKIWHNKNIQWWYRQNIVVYSKNDLSKFPSVSYENAIIRECYEQKIQMLSNSSGIVGPKLTKALKFRVSRMLKIFG